MQKAAALHGLLILVGFLFADGVSAGGPCDAPPYDPLVEVTSAEAAMQMDRWAIRTLRRDYRGQTCDEVQEVVDILLVRWLQAHPEIYIDLNGTETEWLMRTEGAFLLRIKAEALAECKGRRRWFPRSWGRHQDDPSSQAKREDFVRRAGERWGGRKK